MTILLVRVIPIDEAERDWNIPEIFTINDAHGALRRQINVFIYLFLLANINIISGSRSQKTGGCLQFFNCNMKHYLKVIFAKSVFYKSCFILPLKKCKQPPDSICYNY